MPTESVTKILALVEALTTDAELQAVIVRARTIREKRLREHRRKMWERQGPEKMEIDSSRERT